MEKGLMHLYCGDGKGKTTAAAGLAVRAAGCGLRVIFAQFMKGSGSGEITAMKEIPGITVMRNGKNYGFYHQMSGQDKDEIAAEQDAMLADIIKSINRKECDMLILDEITYAYDYGLVCRETVERLVKNRPEGLELVITGRNPARLFSDAADYITEMKCLRHPYEKGIAARKGVEY